MWPSALLPPRRYRWNYTVMGLDISLFVLALSFASAYGVLPLFVSHLSGSTLAVGAIPALRAAALLPPIFVAGLTERLRRKQPFLLGVTVFERVPYLVLAVATPPLARSHPSALLWLCYALLAATTLAAGVGIPAWLDLLARMLPADWRGRFFGHSSALGGLLGVAGSAGAAALLARFDWAVGSALCFACAFAALVASFVCLALGREPAEAPGEAPAQPPSRAGAVVRPLDFPEAPGEAPAQPPSRPAGTAWRRLPALVRNDRNLRRYLPALALLTAAGTTTAFYVVDARGALRLSDGAAGRYAVALLAAATVGNVLWGYVGDHRGHKRVVLGGALCTGLAPLLALVLRDARWGPLGYAAVFLLAGLATSGLQLAALTFIVDLAPREQRPTYIGLANLVQAPCALGAPLLGAALAEARGYPALFALTAALALTATGLVWRGVRDPRTAADRAGMPAEAGG